MSVFCVAVDRFRFKRGPTPATHCPWTCRGPIAGLIECRLDMVDESAESWAE